MRTPPHPSACPVTLSEERSCRKVAKLVCVVGFCSSANPGTLNQSFCEILTVFGKEGSIARVDVTHLLGTRNHMCQQFALSRPVEERNVSSVGVAHAAKAICSGTSSLIPNLRPARSKPHAAAAAAVKGFCAAPSRLPCGREVPALGCRRVLAKGFGGIDDVGTSGHGGVPALLGSHVPQVLCSAALLGLGSVGFAETGMEAELVF